MPGLAREKYEEAMKSLESKLRENPEDHRLHSSLGIAYAGLGLKEEAIRAGERGVDILPVSEDAMSGTVQLEDLAQIYTMVGEYNLAIDQIEYLLSIPGNLSIPLLRIDPKWDPLRENPRFKKLLENEN